jgi:hypothetical protein
VGKIWSFELQAGGKYLQHFFSNLQPAVEEYISSGMALLSGREYAWDQINRL